MRKLTSAQRAILEFLAGMGGPWNAKGPNKAMCGKLLIMGLARYSAGYPIGFSITEAGRKALEESNG